MRNCFGGINVEILDTEMSRKLPNQSTLGYFGITISISVFEKTRNVFLTYQVAEDMVIYGIKMADNFIFNIFKDDYHKMIRKLKLQKINNMNEPETND